MCIRDSGGTTNSRSVFVESDVSKPDEEVNEINAKFKSVDAFPSFREGSKRAIPTVVHIKSTEVRTNRYGYEYLDHSSGSGVIVSSDGYIVTNHHVIETGGSEVSANIEVTLNTKEKFTAKVVGDDPSTDIALLKIDSKDLPYLTIGNLSLIHIFSVHFICGIDA